MSKKRIKILVLLLLIISLILVALCSTFGISISLKSVDEIKKNREYKNNLINNIKINNVDAVYDKNENIYYYPVSEKHENNRYILKLELEYGYKYKIVNHKLNIIKVDYDKPIDVIIYNENYYYETKIILTNLPLISIESEENITFDETNSVIKYVNPNSLSNEISINSKIHIRGATSKIFLKSSYRIHIYDDDYNKEKNVLFSNFYYGSSFILDSIYRDPSKIRNILATNLWNDISNDFTNSGIVTELVEVFINNEYRGLYVLTEPVNRKNLNLSKSSLEDTSIIVKSHGWGTTGTLKNFKNINEAFFMQYEIKYPNNENLYSKVWNKFLSKISDYYNPNIDNTYEVIRNTWNLNNYIDIIIFNAFINNCDNNLIKNNYYYMKSLSSDEVYVQPWDMEYSFGLVYSQSANRLTTKNSDDYKYIYTIFSHPYAPEINKLLISRYWELRKKILTKDYFDKLLDKYETELSKGAAKRDSELWYEYDIKEEIEEIRTWIYNRIDFFDEYVKGLENE